MSSQAQPVLEKWVFPIKKDGLWKVLPVSSVCPRSVTALAFHGNGWTFSTRSLLKCSKGWGI